MGKTKLQVKQAGPKDALNLTMDSKQRNNELHDGPSHARNLSAHLLNTFGGSDSVSSGNATRQTIAPQYKTKNTQEVNALQRQLGNVRVANLFSGSHIKNNINATVDRDKKEADDMLNRDVSGGKTASISRFGVDYHGKPTPKRETQIHKVTVKPKFSIQKQHEPENPPEKPPRSKKTGKAPSADQKRIIAAIVLSEAYPGQEEDIAWIYHNYFNVKGSDSLNASSAYKYKGQWFKVWMTELGSHEYKKDAFTKVKGYKTVGDYVTKNGWFRKVGRKRATKVKEFVDKIFKGSVKNPYEGWFGQGNLDDLNRNTGKWPMARQYLHLQDAGTVKTILVKELTADRPANYTYIFDENSILKYFRDYPEKLPKKVKPYDPGTK